MQTRSGESGYQKKLHHPKWQKRRLDVLNAAGWKCEDAHCRRADVQLEVHHCYYVWGKDPWEYPRDCLMALCESCHEKRQELERAIKINILRVLRDVPVRDLEKISWEIINRAVEQSGGSVG